MRAFTCGMKVVEELLRTRICVLVVLIFVCSSLSDAATECKSDVKSCRSRGSLTNEQRESAVTIDFDFRHIDPKNRTAVDAAIREVRRKILEYLNRKKSTSVPPEYTTPTAFSTTISVATTNTPPTTTSTTSTPTSAVTTTSTPTSSITTTSTPTSTIVTTSTPTSTIVTTSTPTSTIVTTSTPTSPITTTTATTAAAPTTTVTTSAVETTTEIPTSVSTAILTTQAITSTSTKTTTTVPLRTPTDARKRRRRQISDEKDFTDEDLLLVDPEINENGTLTISFFFAKEVLGFNASALGDILLGAIEELNETGELSQAAHNASVIDIYKGLPPSTVKMTLRADYQVWLPILLAIVLLLIIFIFIFTFTYCCKATNKKAKKDEREKIIPKEDTMNGHKPRILDDSTGWLVPYEHFNCEQ